MKLLKAIRQPYTQNQKILFNFSNANYYLRIYQMTIVIGIGSLSYFYLYNFIDHFLTTEQNNLILPLILQQVYSLRKSHQKATTTIIKTVLTDKKTVQMTTAKSIFAKKPSIFHVFPKQGLAYKDEEHLQSSVYFKFKEETYKIPVEDNDYVPEK